MILISSALINAGFKVSQSHAIENAIKTNAPNQVIWDVIRNWAKKTEGDKTKKYSETTPSHIILSKEAAFDYDFTSNPEAIPLSAQIRLIRFQENPTADWGPQSKPKKAKRNRIDHVPRNDDLSNVSDTKKGKL